MSRPGETLVYAQSLTLTNLTNSKVLKATLIRLYFSSTYSFPRQNSIKKVNPALSRCPERSVTAPCCQLLPDCAVSGSGSPPFFSRCLTWFSPHKPAGPVSPPVPRITTENDAFRGQAAAAEVGAEVFWSRDGQVTASN